MQAASAALALPPEHLALLGLICFIAGLVRGFSGFALSAMVMASGALILPPVQLIPVCWWLEMTASLFMLRGGWRQANRKVALGLAVGSTHRRAIRSGPDHSGRSGNLKADRACGHRQSRRLATCPGAIALFGQQLGALRIGLDGGRGHGAGQCWRHGCGALRFGTKCSTA
jgi:hypothetical protein